MSKTITLTNNFHNTEARVIPQKIPNSPYYSISRKTVLRLRRELCGSAECRCGDTFGARDGVHLYVVNEDYYRNVTIDLEANNA